MYKRYYDGYGGSPDCSPRGEIITPKCSEDIYDKCEKAENICNICNDSKEKDKCCNDAKCTSSGEIPSSSSALSCCTVRKCGGTNIFGNIEIDDIILLAIIFIMLKDGTEDSTLIIVLGAIFLFGFID